MILKYVENLLTKIRERQIVVAERLTSGDFQELWEYKETAGTLKGLRESEEIIMNSYKDMVESKSQLNNGESNGSQVKFY
jgi:hypothetical protein